MTRKDYNLLASSIRKALYYYQGENHITEQKAIVHIAQTIADDLHQDNPRFIYLRFYNACGIVRNSKNHTWEPNIL